MSADREISEHIFAPNGGDCLYISSNNEIDGIKSSKTKNRNKENNYFHQYVLTSDNDPGAHIPHTWASSNELILARGQT